MTTLRNQGLEKNAEIDAATSAIENVNTSLKGRIDGLSTEEEQFITNIDPKEANKIYHKVDVRLVPVLAILYLIALIDRANIGNAKIEGLEKSLGMSGTDYNVAVAIFFVPYIIFEIPSNHILSRFNKPSTYLGILICSWGIVMTMTGVVKNLAGLRVTRFFLGVFEILSWCKLPCGSMVPAKKTQTRISIFYTESAASGAFSGLLAFAVVKLDGVGGYEGWRWIFLLEGIASVVAGVACFFILPDSPALSHRWLKPEEARFQLTHIQARGRRSAPNKKVDTNTLFKVLTDWQLYFQGLGFMSNTVPNYGLKFTMPQIIRNMGFTSSNAQLLTAPPYVVAAISGLVSGVLADRFTWRMPFLVDAQLLLIVAYSILVSEAEFISDNVALCYFAVHLACAGLYPIPPGCSAWTVNKLGPAKRPMGVAFMATLGSLGGIIGSFIYIE